MLCLINNSLINYASKDSSNSKNVTGFLSSKIILISKPDKNKTNRLHVADNLMLLASSEQHLRHALDKFSAACDQAWMKINNEKTEVLCLCRNPSQCALQVSSNTLLLVEKFQCLAVVFTGDGKHHKINIRVGKANAIQHALCRSVVTIRKVSHFKSGFVPIVTWGHKSRVMAEVECYLKCKWSWAAEGDCRMPWSPGFWKCVVEKCFSLSFELVT